MQSNGGKSVIKASGKSRGATRREKQKNKQDVNSILAPPGWTNNHEPQVMYSYGSDVLQTAMVSHKNKPGLNIEVQYRTTGSFTGSGSEGYVSLTTYVGGKAADIKIPIDCGAESATKPAIKARTKEKRLITTWVDGKKMMHRRCPDCNSRAADTGCYHCQAKLCAECQHEHMKPYIMQAAEIAKNMPSVSKGKALVHGKELEVVNVYSYDVKDGKKKKIHELPKEIPTSLIDTSQLNNSNMLILHTREEEGKPLPTQESIMEELMNSMKESPPNSRKTVRYHVMDPTKRSQADLRRAADSTLEKYRINGVCSQKTIELMTAEEENLKTTALEAQRTQNPDDMPLDEIKEYLTVFELAVMLRIQKFISGGLDAFEFYNRECHHVKNRITQFQRDAIKKLFKSSSDFTMEAMLDIQRQVDIFQNMAKQLEENQVSTPYCQIYSEDDLIALDEKFQILKKGSRASGHPLNTDICREMITRVRRAKPVIVGYKIIAKEERRRGDTRYTLDDYGKTIVDFSPNDSSEENKEIMRLHPDLLDEARKMKVSRTGWKDQGSTVALLNENNDIEQDGITMEDIMSAIDDVD